ncbi:MAG: glycoside hydrolase family 28 protein [Bacteroidetes bacterium]|nr:glycoside hydrolase family 28 protein [Bacteroidota bacterium]
MKYSRRTFLTQTMNFILTVPLLGTIITPCRRKTKELKNLQRPKFNGTIFNVRDYGATGNGSTIDTHALQATINRCHVLGGGIVKVPKGTYRTGALQLRSNVFLHLDDGATLVGTASFIDYPLMQVRWEGKWIEGHTALLYAIDATNLGICGQGTIIGNPALGGRPTQQYPYRHPALIEFINCTNIHLEGFSAEYTRMWCIHPTYCENVRITGLTIRSTGGNSDGIDIDSCKNVEIDNCTFNTGDDCIALKSGRGMEGYLLARPTENVHITNCTFTDTLFACIGIGSETSGGIRNVRIDHCTFTDTKTYALYIKSRLGRGSFIENISAEHLTVKNMHTGFLRINLLTSGLQDQHPVPGYDGIPTARNFKFTTINVCNVPLLVDATSIHPEKPLDGLHLEHIRGTCQKGIFLANIKNTVVRSIEVHGFTGSLLSVYNVTGDGLENAQQLLPPPVPDSVQVPESSYKFK